MTTPRKPTLIAFAVVAILALAGCGSTGSREAIVILPETEAELGRKLHDRTVEQYGGEYQDAALSDLVDRIVRRLGEAEEESDLPYTVILLDSPMPVAITNPGGNIFLARGLFALIDDETELASVLAHEMGHVTARHWA